MPPIEVDDTVDAFREVGDNDEPRGEARTPEGELLEPGSLSNERVRRAVHRRVFGEVVEPLRIGRYAVLKRIGAGGMGVVYAAYDTELDRKVALKLLAFDSTDPARASTRRARLVREAKALARLSHPAIVQVFEVGTHEDQLFIAMEYVDGVTLGQWTRSASRGWREIVAMYREAGRGLAAAHAAGLVHRDFKPDNALVGKDGRLRVLDFGLAEVGDADASSDDSSVADVPESLRGVPVPLTQTGALLGTPAYMAPEQHLGHRADARSDQFGFCIALWEAVYGGRPFTGESLPALATSVIEGRITATSGGRDVPGHLRRVLLQGLAPKPDDRWPTMDALLGALDQSLGTAPRRAALGVAAATSAMVLGLGVLWLNSTPDGRTAELEGEVALERSRADATEQALVKRDDSATIAEATAMLERDPTRAIAMLGGLRADAPAWSDGRARMIAADAVARGVAAHVVPLPDAAGPRVLSPGGRWAWTTDPGDGRYLLVELATGRRVELEAGMAEPFPHLTFSTDESKVVTAQSGAVRLWDLTTGTSRLLATLEGFAAERRYADAVGRVVVIDEGERTEAIMIDLAGATRRRALERRSTYVVTPDTRGVVAYDGRTLDWFALDSDEHRVLDQGVFGGLTVAPDGSVAATPSPEGILVTSLTDWKSFVLPVAAGLRGGALFFDPTSSTLATVTPVGTILVFDLATREVRRLGDGRPRPDRLVLAPGGRRIAALAPDGTVVLHDRGGDARVLRADGGITDVALAADHTTVVTVGSEPRARLWSWPTTRAIELEGGAVRDVEIAGDGAWVYAASGDTVVRRAGAGDDAWASPAMDPRQQPPAIALSADDATLAIGSSERVTRFDAEGRATESVAASTVGELDFVADGALAWREKDGVALWRTGTTTPQRWSGKWRAAVMSPDATAFATLDAATDGNLLTVWDAATSQARWTAPADATWGVLRFDPSGRSIAAVGFDDTIAVFTAADGTRRDLPVAHDRYSDVELTADGRVLFALGERAHVVALGSGAAYEVAIPAGMATWGGRTIDATPDGRTFAFAGSDGIVWRHAFEAPADPLALREWVAAATDFEQGRDR